jgi:hypothetical protein
MVLYVDIGLVRGLAICLEEHVQDYRAASKKLESIRAKVIETMETLERLGLRFPGGHEGSLADMVAAQAAMEESSRRLT